MAGIDGLGFAASNHGPPEPLTRERVEALMREMHERPREIPVIVGPHAYGRVRAMVPGDDELSLADVYRAVRVELSELVWRESPVRARLTDVTES